MINATVLKLHYSFIEYNIIFPNAYVKLQSQRLKLVFSDKYFTNKITFRIITHFQFEENVIRRFSTPVHIMYCVGYNFEALILTKKNFQVQINSNYKNRLSGI